MIRRMASSAPMRPTGPEAYMPPNTVPPRPSRNSVVVPDLFGKVLTVYANGVDRYFQFAQLCFVRFPFG